MIINKTGYLVCLQICKSTSNSIYSQLSTMEEGQVLSKRELKKLEQTIKLFSRSDPKPRKKRKRADIYAKVSPNIETTEQSIRQSADRQDYNSEDFDSEVKDQKPHKNTSHQSINTKGITQHLQVIKERTNQPATKIIFNEENLKIQQKDSLFDYLMEYEYNEMEKKYQKSNRDFKSYLRNVRGQEINTIRSVHLDSIRLFHQKNNQIKGETPFSKVHKKFKQALLQLLEK